MRITYGYVPRRGYCYGLWHKGECITVIDWITAGELKLVDPTQSTNIRKPE